MNKVKVDLWGREFELFISYSCYPGEEITDVQKDAVDIFCNNIVNVDSMLDMLKEYVEKTSEAAVKSNEIENIFKYVMPKNLFVPRCNKSVVAIICNYKFDMENGIAIVFEDGKFKELGTQDIII